MFLLLLNYFSSFFDNKQESKKETLNLMELLPKELEDIIMDYKYQLEHHEKKMKICKDINDINYCIYENKNTQIPIHRYRSKRIMKDGSYIYYRRTIRIFMKPYFYLSIFRNNDGRRNPLLIPYNK